MLNASYRLTDPRPELASSFESFATQLTNIPVSGTYNDGLLTVVDQAASEELLRCWAWLLGKDGRALITTGFGDVFFWNSKGVSFLEVQRGEVEFLGSDVGWFLGEFLSNPKVVQGVLRKPAHDQLVSIRGPLKYHQVFILVPWPMLGGEDRPENYDTGACDVYLHLVGQALEQT